MAATSSERPQYAGFAPRLLALTIDGFIFIPNYYFQKLSYDQGGAIAVTIFLSLLGPLYNILLLGFYGQTVGMMVTRIKVARLDLNPLRWPNAILRYLVNLLIGLLYVYVEVCLMPGAGPEYFNKSLTAITLGLTSLDDSFQTFLFYGAFISIAWTLSELVVLLLNKKKRAIHDFMGGTVVVRVDEKKGILLQSQAVPSSTLSNIFAGIIVAGAVLAGVGLGYYQFVLKNKLAKLFVPPPELQTAGVRKGQGFVAPVAVLQESRIGETMDLAADPANPGTYLAAGKKGILSLRPTGEVLKTIFFDFKTPIDNLRWVVAGDWVGLMNRGSWISPAFVMDREGKTLWTYAAPKGVDDMAAGNIGGDSKPRFVVGLNGAGGIHLLDEMGQPVWEMPGQNIWHVEAADIDGSGKDEIIHSDAGGKLLVRNDKGEVIKAYRPSVYASHFFLVPWPQGGERWAAVMEDKSKFLFYGLVQGATIAEWDSGIMISNGKTRGLWVDWNPGGARSLALLTNYSPVKTSFLTLFDESGQIQYQEVFGEPCGALLAVDGATAGTHELWCGCDNKILKYQKAP